MDDPNGLGGDAGFLRPGLPRGTLRKLRRGHWAVQGELDLHGFTSDQALSALAGFIAQAAARGSRCVRVIHGKGLRSPGREPVLKAKVKAWLVRRKDVLAYCEAPDSQGGSGALLVLFRG